MAKTSAERQGAFRARLKRQGFVTVTGIVPEAHAAAVASMMRMLREDKDLEPGPVRNVKTGRFSRL